MANKRVVWDACAWIALIQQERIRDEKENVTEDRFAMCRSVIGAAQRDQVEIACSALCYAEVCKNKDILDAGQDKIAAFFEHDFVLPVNLDRAVGEKARQLMMAGQLRLKPADACHLATAIIANADELHTFDGRILALDGKIEKADGVKLKICKPDPGGKPAPLLDAMKAKPNEEEGKK